MLKYLVSSNVTSSYGDINFEQMSISISETDLKSFRSIS